MKYRTDRRQPAILWVAMLLTSVLLAALTAGERIEINQHIYEKENGQWYQLAGGERFAVDSRVITIKVKPGASQRSVDAIHDGLNAAAIRTNSLGFTDVQLPVGSDPLAAVRTYLAGDAIEIAEVNTIGRYIATPNDPNLGTQWHLEQVSDADIDATTAWDHATGSSTIIVGILDSGTDWTHDDMGTGTDGYQNIWLNPGEDAWSNPNNPGTGNGIDDDGNGYIDDWKGYDFNNNNNDARGPFDHGTLVAGIVGAKTNNGKGIAGLAGGWGAAGSQLMTLGVGDFAPSGAILDDAILYAAEHGARIITMSLTVGQTAAIDAALEAAYVTYGLFIDCASGNNYGAVTYPATHVRVVSVGATDEFDQRAAFSNYGANLDIAAPGVNIYSCTFSNGYTSSSGTSFSAPQVGGLAALMLSANSSLTNVGLLDIMKNTADKVGGYNYNWSGGMPGHSQELGYGRINAGAAVAEAAGGGTKTVIAAISLADSNYVIPAGGGSVIYQMYFENTQPAQTQVDIDIDLIMPDNTQFNILTGKTLTIGPLNNTTKQHSRNIPAQGPPGTYRFVLFVSDHGSGTILCTDTMSVDKVAAGLVLPTGALAGIEGKESVPLTVDLVQNYPNPFNPSTTIRYSIDSQRRVRLAVYDLLGRQVAVLLDGDIPAGYGSVEWDGRNAAGTPVTSGIYIYRLTASATGNSPAVTHIRKMLLTR